MKQLAAKADERWRSVPSFLDAPKNSQTGPAMGVTDSKPPDVEQGGVLSAVEGQAEEVGGKGGKGKKEESPWAKADRDRGAPSENYQPGAWTPAAAGRRG